MRVSPELVPRNLTARASRRILGNPASSRPESGVNNCYPGLEFDQRTIETAFIPGLRFEFHRPDGAILIEPVEKDDPAVQPVLDLVSQADGGPVFLTAVTYLDSRGSEEHRNFSGQSGLRTWSYVRRIPPGPMAVLLSAGEVRDWDHTRRVLARLKAQSEAPYWEAQTIDARPDSPCVAGYVLRSDYLTSRGVLDPAAYEPGVLTQTMCAPWMYDFRDCFCFYWASNKPDMAASANAPEKPVDFIRKVRDGPHEAEDQPSWWARIDSELTHDDFVEGAWARLPVVLDDRETFAPYRPLRKPPAQTLARKELIDQLARAAAIEHALMTEYLYARYSVETVAPDSKRADTLAFVTDALLRVAIDEMRHFNWVNRILLMLGAPPCVARARYIFEPVKAEDSKTPAELRAVAFRPLTAATLQDFVDAERHSNVSGLGIDGLYVNILHALLAGPADIPEAPRIIPYVKLIVDEGADHFREFRAIQAQLAGMPEADYLRELGPPSLPAHHALLDILDMSYSAILDAIRVSQTLAPKAARALIRSAVHSMRTFDEIARQLAGQGVSPRFRPPSDLAENQSHEMALSVVRRKKDALNHLIETLRGSGFRLNIALEDGLEAHLETSVRIIAEDMETDPADHD